MLPDRKLDLRGTIIPLALLKTSQEFLEIEPGETMEILINDPDTKRDLFKILRPLSYKLIDIEEEGSFYRIRLGKEG